MRWHTLGQVVFVLAAAGVFYLARLPVGRTGAVVHDASRVVFSAMVLGWLVYAIVMAWRNSLTTRGQPGGAKNVHSAPRRFGVGKLFLITLAFALFVTGMRFLQAHPALTIAGIVFFAVVGGLQMAFDRAPRRASMIAGGILVPTTLLVLWLAGDEGLLSAAPTYLPFLELVFSLACWSVAGGAAGYVMGTLVGGVFLMANALRPRGRLA